MIRQDAVEEYKRALRLGQKEYKERVMSGKPPYPAVLDELHTVALTDAVQDVGLIEIPAELIVGTKSAGRISAFTAGFLPLLDMDSEFATKWVELCVAHLSDEGIRDPIVCYEYLGKFYVQEGNKRVSVLKYHGAPRIPGLVKRLLPAQSEEPRIKAYYEFLDFYKASKIYAVQFRRTGDYAKLLSSLGKEPGESWTEREQKTFRAYFHYFTEAFTALGGEGLDLRPEEALLLWLKVYPFQDLGKLSTSELKKAMQGLWEDITALSQETPELLTNAAELENRTGIFSRIMASSVDHLNVAFIHPKEPQDSAWVKAHVEGSQYLEKVLPNRVTVRNYYNASTNPRAELLLDQAVEEGAQVIFTTSPQISRATLKAAVKYPKLRFLNCSLAAPYSSVRTYYSRIYEGKFITGAIAGAMAQDDRIGYVSAYPIYGEPASINAFALGAQLTNPRAKIVLRWSCLPGSHVADMVKDGIRVISNKDVPTDNKVFLDFGDYGIYQVGSNGSLTSLASPFWAWGKFYENVIRSILSGAWGKNGQRAVNYWWGMESGVIDVKFSEKLPDGLLVLANMLRKGFQAGTIDPFRRRIVAQDGTVMNDGNASFMPDDLLRMDWLCENVEGFIPEYEDILPMAQPLVRELGLHREQIPQEKEGSL